MSCLMIYLSFKNVEILIILKLKILYSIKNTYMMNTSSDTFYSIEDTDVDADADMDIAANSNINNETMPENFSLVESSADVKQIYRGGQPNDSQLKQLNKLGVKHIINLRKEGLRQRNRECDVCNILDIGYHPFPHYGIFGVSIESINEIVDCMHQLDGPIYVHCLHGRDRTGLIIASYLVKYCNKDPALTWQKDVIKFGHDDDSILYSQFKPSYDNFCNHLKKDLNNDSSDEKYCSPICS